MFTLVPGMTCQKLFPFDISAKDHRRTARSLPKRATAIAENNAPVNLI